MAAPEGKDAAADELVGLARYHAAADPSRGVEVTAVLRERVKAAGGELCIAARWSMNEVFGDPLPGVLKAVRVEGPRGVVVLEEHSFSPLHVGMRGCLHVLRAEYGHRSLRWVDVTAVAQSLVRRAGGSSMLSLSAPLNSLFGDPCKGVAKEVVVEYQFGASGRVHRLVVPEGGTALVSDALRASDGDALSVPRLLVFRAWYGSAHWGPEARFTDACPAGDVTEAIAQRVSEDGLHIAVDGSEPGVGSFMNDACGRDPEPGREKVLVVYYTCGDGRGRVAMARERTPLHIVSTHLDPQLPVIVGARYGTFCPRGSSVDVRKQLDAFASGRPLVLDQARVPLNSLFGDPAPGVVKSLRIQYTLACATGNRAFVAEVREHGGVFELAATHVLAGLAENASAFPELLGGGGGGGSSSNIPGATAPPEEWGEDLDAAGNASGSPVDKSG